MCFKSLIIALLACGLSWSVAAAWGADAADTIRLWVWPQCVVDGDVVTLADVVSLSGLSADVRKAAESARICDAPEPGRDVEVTIGQIRRALPAAGLNPARVCLAGAARCRVTRPASVGTARNAEKTGRKRPDSSDDNAWPEGCLAEAIRRYFDQRLAYLGGTVEVRFSPACKAALSIRGDDLKFKIYPRSSAVLGLVSLEVEVTDARGRSRLIPVVAEVSLLREVVVARRAINRGAVIRQQDVRLEERRFNRLERIGLTDLAAAIGQQARRYIARGEMITARDIRPRPLVRRGEYVTVWLERAGLTLRASAKALQDGTYGQRIEVRAEPGGQVYTAVVTGPKTVRVPGSGSGRMSGRQEKD